MINYLTGDIWTSKAEAIVIPVNTVGVMRTGLALEAKERDPKAFEEYSDFCRRGFLEALRIRFYINLSEGKHLVFFATQDDYRFPSKLENIDRGLKKFAIRTCVLKRLGVKTVAFPHLGCGCGGLDWKDVKPIMEKYLKDLDLEIEIWEKEEEK